MWFTYTSAVQRLCGILLVLSAIVLPVAFAQEQDKKPDGKALFEQKCLKCHKPEKFTSENNDRKGWELIVSRMERNGCTLSENEQNVLVEYLAKVHGE